MTSSAGVRRRPFAPRGAALRARPSGFAVGAETARPASLKRNFLWVLAGYAAAIGSKWGRVVVLGHLGGLEMVGLMALAFAVCAPVNALAGLGLRSAVVTDARGEYRFADYLGLRLLCAVAAWAVVVGMALLGGYDRSTMLVIVLVAASETLVSLSDIFHALLQQRERMNRITVSMGIRGLLMLGLLAAGVYLTGSAVWGAAGLAVAAAAALVFYDLPSAAGVLREREAAAEPLRPAFDRATLARLAWKALPLGVVLMLLALRTNLPRYVITNYLDHRALGAFVSIFYVGLVGSKVIAALGQTSTPRLAKYHAAGNQRAFAWLLVRLLALAAALGTAMVVGMAAFGQPALKLLYNADFSQYQRLAVLMMAVAGATYLATILGIAVEAARRFRLHMAIQIAAMIVLVAALPWAVGRFGLEGAAGAMLLSALTAVALAAGCVAVLGVWGKRGVME